MLRYFIKGGEKMGTLSLTMVYHNGEYKVSQYGQFDGDPVGVGSQLLKYLKGINREYLTEVIDKCTYLTKQDFDRINDTINETKRDLPNFRWEEWYPELSRETGADILDLIAFQDKTCLRNSLDFAGSSDCEWAYVVDLDKNSFEVYVGYNHEPLNESDRFYFLMPIAEKENKKYKRAEGKEYYPVKFVTEYDLDNLPDEETFVKEVDKICGFDEE